MGIKALMESKVLNDETKQVIEEAFAASIAAKEAELKESYEIDLLAATSEIMESVQVTIGEVIAEEMSSIADELNEARSLEVTYADKLEKFKLDYVGVMESKIKFDVADIVAEEIEELREGIEKAKQHEFAMQLFENYKGVYERMFGAADVNVFDKLEESKQELATYKRKAVMADLLESVSGDKRKVAETILENTATDKLVAKFESIKSFLLAESAQTDTTKVALLSESATKPVGRLVMDNAAPVIEESDDSQQDPYLARLQRSLQIAR